MRRNGYERQADHSGEGRLTWLLTISVAGVLLSLMGLVAFNGLATSVRIVEQSSAAR